MRSDSQSSFGEAFASQGGGVFAMEWTSNYIRMWSFAPASIPDSIITGNPDVSTFGTPSANMEGSCDIDQHFSEHVLVSLVPHPLETAFG